MIRVGGKVSAKELQRRLQAIVGDAAGGGPGSIAFGDQARFAVLALAGGDPYRFRPPGGQAALAPPLPSAPFGG